MAKNHEVDLFRAAESNRDKRNISCWLNCYAHKIFETVPAGKDYVAITSAPPQKLHLFTTKIDVLNFMRGNLISDFRYRYDDEMILML